MKKLLIQGVGLVLLAGFIAGCQTALETATGKPEIRVYQSNVNDIQTVTTLYFRDKGYTPAEVDEMGLSRPVRENDMVFERPHHQATNLIGVPSASRILVSIDTTPEDGVKVLRGEAFTVGDVHTGFENVVPAERNYPELQADLYNIRRNLEAARRGGTARVASVQVQN
ncbi:hypothetical protein [Pedosphaera parvula]|nr:hypothetical protein [Pedosphaera parvula]